jgi:hypothetical protein
MANLKHSTTCTNARTDSTRDPTEARALGPPLFSNRSDTVLVVIFDRLRGKAGPQMRVVQAWSTGREPQFNVVGESRYYQQISKVAARLGGGQTGEAITVAILKPEPDNPYDKHAVQATIDDLVVGYLPAEEAPNYSPLLLHLAAQGVLVSVPARVWWDAEDGYMASVRLDLAPPGLLVPLNAPPAGNVMQLPPGSATWTSSLRWSPTSGKLRLSSRCTR